jgi:hypothetical protein
MKKYTCETKVDIDTETLIEYMNKKELELSPELLTEMFLTQITNRETLIAINKTDYILMSNMIKELVKRQG